MRGLGHDEFPVEVADCRARFIQLHILIAKAPIAFFTEQRISLQQFPTWDKSISHCFSLEFAILLWLSAGEERAERRDAI